MIILWIIVAIIMFSLVILIHEWGHFATARKFWVRVEEFGLGIPPRAKKLFIDKKWTLFSLNRLPLWWFVRLTWEQPTRFNLYDKNWKKLNNIKIEKYIKENQNIFLFNKEKITLKDKNEIIKALEENNASYNLANKPAWQQSIIILAWVFMNFLLATLIFSLLFFFWVKPIWVNTKIATDLKLKLLPTYEQAIDIWLLEINPWVKLYPIENSIAEKSWITEWDILIGINIPCHSELDSESNNCKSIIINSNTPEEVKKIVSENPWKELIFSIDSESSSEWQNQKKEILITPSLDWKIWSYLSENISISEDFKYNYWPIDSIKYGTVETYSQILLTFKWLKILAKKIFAPETPVEREEALQQMSWPIWIVDFISNSIWAWFVFILIIWAIISINLWVFNLLPIPALDWWRFIFITMNWLIHKVFWKKIINEQTEGLIHLLFFIVLIALSLLIWYNDVIKIIDR